MADLFFKFGHVHMVLHTEWTLVVLQGRFNTVLLSVETDRNPNVDYRQKPNILLNPKYSANCRIPEYYAPTACGQLFGFGRIFG